jgi:hypothetical protein
VELAKRISDLWTGTLQLNGVWIVRSDRTSDVIREALLSCLNLGLSSAPAKTRGLGWVQTRHDRLARGA